MNETKNTVSKKKSKQFNIPKEARLIKETDSKLIYELKGEGAGFIRWYIPKKIFLCKNTESGIICMMLKENKQ